LGLDIATVTGWAAYERDSHGKMSVETGLVDLENYKYDFGHMASEFESLIEGLIVKHRPDLVAVERPFYRGGGKAIYHLNGLAFLAQKVAWEKGVRRKEGTVHEVRKWLVGKGNASKVEVRDIITGMGYGDMSLDEADALAVAMWAWRLEVGD
jgi:crossover junction endodeoxyribonuclease RuvC